MLPDDIAKSHAYLTKLLETCAQLPFHDVARTLRHAFEQERKKGYNALADFMERLPTYTKRYLNEKVQEQLNASNGLLHSLRGTMRLLAARPENWSFWGEEDLPRLLDRQKGLQEQVNNLDSTSSAEAKEIQHLLAKVSTIILALELQNQAGGIAVNASELDAEPVINPDLADIDISVCPLTGIHTRGQAKLEISGEYISYRFKPIGMASFTFDSLTEAIELISLGREPLTDWAGLCRQADELGQGVVLVGGWPEDEHDAIPETFEEKRLHFLRLLCEAGGNEYRERTINTFDDFPMAFARDAEEFSRILKSLLADHLIKYDTKQVVQGDWKKGIQAHYHKVLPTTMGKQLIDSSKLTVTATVSAPRATSATPSSLAHLHQAVQQAVGSRFSDGYYSDALHKACTALEKSVQDKANQPSEPTGATLMSKVFSKDKPILVVSSNQGEQEGYMFLYRGLAQAIRNHYAHNDPATDPARALEWLCFISALFYKLDEAQALTPPLT